VFILFRLLACMKPFYPLINNDEVCHTLACSPVSKKLLQVAEFKDGCRRLKASGGFRGGPSRLRPSPFGDGLTPSLTVLLNIGDNGTVLWRHHCQSISSNTWKVVFRVFKIISTSGFLTALQCTKFVVGRGSAPDPAGGASCAPLDP